MTEKRFKSEVVNVLIGEDSHLNGTLHSQRSIRIEGHFEGEINSQGEVYIGEKSTVKATVVGKRVVVSGEFTGKIEAINGLHITKSGKVYGDIAGNELTIEEGAIYKGQVNMDVISSKNNYEGSISIKKNTP